MVNHHSNRLLPPASPWLPCMQIALHTKLRECPHCCCNLCLSCAVPVLPLARACLALQNGRVAATPRQLEAMIRISEALARMHLRTEVGAGMAAGLVTSVSFGCMKRPALKATASKSCQDAAHAVGTNT